jgi:protein-L-isoaspartate(D-aspartate) O-methyltransferase
MSDHLPEPLEPIAARRKMIEQQIRARGIRNPRVLDAILSTPREEFLPPERQGAAYEDRALALAHGQTISQPFIVAYMTELLDVQPHHRVLEVGTGSGYQCAILAQLAPRVYSIERIDELRLRATENLARLDIRNVELYGGDGTLGLPEFAPFDRIIVTAASPSIPEALKYQLADGGVLVIPIGTAQEQTIVVARKSGERLTESGSLPCRFVKLIGREGWREEDVVEE